jgi:hypothetical protein
MELKYHKKDIFYCFIYRSFFSCREIKFNLLLRSARKQTGVVFAFVKQLPDGGICSTRKIGCLQRWAQHLINRLECT